jgi:hypothetical protein
MQSVDEVMAELKKKGNEKTRKTYARHGVQSSTCFSLHRQDRKSRTGGEEAKGNQVLIASALSCVHPYFSNRFGLGDDSALSQNRYDGPPRPSTMLNRRQNSPDAAGDSTGLNSRRIRLLFDAGRYKMIGTCVRLSVARWPC